MIDPCPNTGRRPARLRPGRSLLSVLAALLTLCVLAACGSADPSTPTGEQQAGAAAFPVDIEHKFGTTTIPAEPQRVLTVGWNDQDYVLALGVVPVSTRSWYEEYATYPWVQETLQGKPLPAFSDEIDLEAIAEQRPDLILAIYESLDQETYDKLSQIAPTVVQSGDYPDEQTPWDVQTLTTGKALGRSEQAQALVDEVNAKLEEAKTANPQFTGKVLVAHFGDSTTSYWLLAEGDPRRSLFDSLGFQAQEEKDEISAERVDLLDRDVLFVNGAPREDLLAQPGFAQLDVVTSDRTVYTELSTPLSGALAYGGPKAQLYALDLLVPELAAATDGDPATKVGDL